LIYADSTASCNSSELSFGTEEHFMGCSVSQRFSWPMIEPVNDEVNLVIGDCIEQAAWVCTAAQDRWSFRLIHFP